MAETLFQAYAPLVFWTGLGLLIFRFLPDTLPRLLGRALYWVGVPLQIFTLARQTDWSGQIGFAPWVTVMALGLGLAIATLSLALTTRDVAEPDTSEGVPIAAETPSAQARQGSYLISSMLGNTGFVGLAIVPTLVDESALGWVVFYSVTQNIIGTYGLGVLIASRYGRGVGANGWVQLRDVATVPSLWAFVAGSAVHDLSLPMAVDDSLRASIWVVIPTALLLMGMRLSQLNGWKSLQSAIRPSLIKVAIVPALLGVLLGFMPVDPQSRLAVVLMAGMPTAFAGLILAEEYELDRDLIASSIVLTTALLGLTLPLWLLVWG